MLSQSADNKINFYSAKIIESNKFLCLAREGKITKEQVAKYAFNLKYVLSMTPPSLRLARDIALQNGEQELSAFFSEKIIEEDGHEQWAANDVASLGYDVQKMDPKSLNQSIVELMSYVQKIIEKDPKYYLIYMLFVEKLTVQVAPHLLESLDKNCGIPPTSFTAIANHEELDREHVKDDMIVIDRFIGSPEDSDSYLQVIDFSFTQVDRFLEAMTHSGESQWN
jgi:hypothetical protein